VTKGPKRNLEEIYSRCNVLSKCNLVDLRPLPFWDMLGYSVSVCNLSAQIINYRIPLRIGIWVWYLAVYCTSQSQMLLPPSQASDKKLRPKYLTHAASEGSDLQLLLLMISSHSASPRYSSPEAFTSRLDWNFTSGQSPLHLNYRELLPSYVKLRLQPPSLEGP
jgi:hypothetical protein